MRLSDLLLFPDSRLTTDDGLTLTTFSNDPVDDPDVTEILNQLVAAESADEVRMILTLAFQNFCDGKFNVNVNGSYGIEDEMKK